MRRDERRGEVRWKLEVRNTEMVKSGFRIGEYLLTVFIKYYKCCVI